MKILFADQFSDLGGAQFVLRDLIAETKRRGWEPELAAPGDGPLLNVCPSRTLPLPAYANGRKRLFDVLRYGFDMRRSSALIRDMVRTRRPDVIYVNGPRVLPAASGHGIPVVFHAHSLLARGYARWIVQRSLRGSTALTIASSRFVSATIRSGDSVVIYNGVKDLGFRLRVSARVAPHIGIVGRISPEKGHLDFIEASKAITRRGLSCRFSVFGAGLFSDPAYERKVRAAAEGCGVEFRGWAENAGAALDELDVLAVPSSDIEATPRVIMEAFSAGLPVVAYPSGGIPELIRHGETGLLTARPDAWSLASSMEYLLSDAKLISKLSRSGRNEWERHFQLHRMTREICDLLQSRFARAAEDSATGRAVAVM